ncbi:MULTISPECIES: sulfite exporter TauE/SafE family protein [unclassified Thermoactinomyces]|jgi:uncharacterized protein|uniref:sulfite exporter TauE/SafE family protein n=1 Tax=unclassified Thermoactinomyces TaxID=2634588 RepID=UPI0018DE87DF|nr:MULTISPECIES: sulfite exporter TauE/SafE family protein [unclassified Thermoactinomyces]MBH8599257.1 sulfite exporter TauE/SafE family protein [Thermoactinomyces sp. CICC 10523]MBH8605550.1 sulfite exporter TauE/SafE family protein [Thermoactinomyces sp. CICC 10522]MBH8609291.1 sulfite exporter TauE/SafE family protein [Thermoactinomyces sp. CICC 10521]
MYQESCLLFFTGLFASFLGTLAGGGGLITIPAMMIFGLPVQIGVATNKFSSGIASLSSVVTLIRHKEITWKQIWRYLFVAMIGGMIGAAITSHLNEHTMNVTAIFLLIFALLISMKKWDWGNKKTVSWAKKLDLLWTCLIAAYDGGFGPGSSTFGILHYVNLTRAYIRAVQLTRVLILGSCLGAFMIFYHTGYFQWKYAIPLALGSVIGTELALKVLPRIPGEWARKLINIIIFLLIMEVGFKLI